MDDYIDLKTECKKLKLLNIYIHKDIWNKYLKTDDKIKYIRLLEIFRNLLNSLDDSIPVKFKSDGFVETVYMIADYKLSDSCIYIRLDGDKL